MTTWNAPLTVLKGVGESQAQKFAILGVKTIGDLIEYFPRRYDDYSQITRLADIRPGLVSIRATIEQVKGHYVRRGMHITEAVAVGQEDDGKVRLVWFNQPYRAAAIKPGQPYFIAGQYELSHSRFAIMNPTIELATDLPLSNARIIPVYRETKGLTSRQIRQAVQRALELLVDSPDSLPDWLVRQEKLINYKSALTSIHFPETTKALSTAQKRLGFEEVFRLTLASLLNKYELLQDHATAIPYQENIAVQFSQKLPFRLTNAQRLTVKHIYDDLQRTQPMNRLVEGDVGSGKTVVATMAALMPIAAGYQVALMTPTELLARQHAETIYKLLKPLGLEDRVGLLVGSMTTAEKKQAYSHLTKGHLQFIIGTQALIQEKVDMHKLGLIIIDEQHRFGVEQRQKLMAKAGHMPHMLSLTATPIPRSLALTLYGELDISVLNDKPPGRQPIETEIISPNSRTQLYAKIDQQLSAGRQMFVVCPLITESGNIQASSAEQIYHDFTTSIFKHRRTGLLHGKLKAEEKNAIMERFVKHELDILVSTTVIEVGVDVPNASVMLIEAAERFGLAQIHQLRGRVGRGEHAGYCYLMMSDSSAPPKRLEALARSSDGFKLAELDLELRGPGAIYGTMQHGQLDLRIAKLTDVRLITAARQTAQQFIDCGTNLLQYPQLYNQVQSLRTITNLN